MPEMVTSDLGACEWFVWDLRRSGLIDRGTLDTIVGEFLKRNPRAEAPALAEFLVEQETLTAFQAERVLNGKTQGLVLGPYVLLDAIGAGSMGQVYRASSKNDGNMYAVKVLPRRSMWNVRLARRQVRSFGSFNHPAVIPFVDVGTAGGLHYLVWPLVEGTTLEGLIQQMGKLPSNLAALYAVQVAQGLTESHQNNLFHGLLKPSNIMIGSDNQARILDFGIGSLLVENEGESLVDTMSTANTLTSGLDCASPESIMEPTNRTPAGDQYSLGCTLYYCLTGHVPFPEGSAVEKMMAHQTRDPMPIRELAPDVPEGMAAVVKRLMAKTPEERYGACDEVVEALEPFLGDVSAIPGGLPGVGARTPAPGNSLGNRSGGGSNQSSGRMPGLGSQPGGRMPATKAASAPSAPSLPTRGGSTAGKPPQSGEKPFPGKAQPPVPQRQNSSVPSRATLHLPPVNDDSDAGIPGLPTAKPAPRMPTRATTAPAAPPAKAAPPAPPAPMAKAASRTAPMTKPVEVPAEEEMPYGMADEEAAKPHAAAKGGFGPVALVLIALILMIAVFFGATMLMNQ
jgi:serine/threonine-protein kinase